MFNPCRLGLGGLIVLLLSACGGGGGGSSGPPNLSSAPGQAALSAWLQANHSYTLNATDASGNNWQLQISSSPNAGTTTFNGTANASSDTQTVNLFKNGAAVGNSVDTAYFTLNPYVRLGSVSNSGVYEIDSNQAAFPMTLTVGQSGPVDSFTYYHDSTLTTVDATGVDTYSVKANNASTLLICAINDVQNVTAQGTTDGYVTETETDCYTDDASGNLSLSSVTVTGSGVTLTFQ